MTGIELSEDGCVLVEVRRGMILPRLSAVVVIEPPFWPPSSLESLRRRKRFSPQARVVSWSPDEATLKALTDAGFTIETIISPERALAILAAEREHGPSDATALAALSRRGAAFAIVRRGEVLYSRRVEWRYKTVTRPNQQLLQRYLFVSHLAPEIQEGIRVVGAPAWREGRRRGHVRRSSRPAPAGETAGRGAQPQDRDTGFAGRPRCHAVRNGRPGHGLRARAASGHRRHVPAARRYPSPGSVVWPGGGDLCAPSWCGPYGTLPPPGLMKHPP